eukprot:9512826-Alexandrium_andersonii.AAC.1
MSPLSIVPLQSFSAIPMLISIAASMPHSVGPTCKACLPGTKTATSATFLSGRFFTTTGEPVS